MPASRRSLLLLPAVAAATLTACSGTSRPPAVAGSSTPSAAGFVATADQICADQDHRERRLGPGLVNADIVPTSHLAKAADFLDRIVAIKTEGLNTLQRLAADSTAADRAARQTFVRSFQQIVTDYRDAAAAAHNGDMAHFRSAFDRVAPGGHPDGPDATAFNKAAAAFSFSACGKGSRL